MIDTTITVEPSHFEYLKLQKGKLDPLKATPSQWTHAYRRDLVRTYEEIKPWLPSTCWGLLDVGSGLGGIDVLLYRHYVRPGEPIDVSTVEDTDAGRGTVLMRGRIGPYINLLDGEDDAPEMHLHRETFNSMTVAKDFQVKNGVPPDRFAYYTPASESFVKPFDLVVSFGSWCFHYEPNVYLPRLLQAGGLHRDTRIIVDKWRGKPDWDAQLNEHLQCFGVIREEKKYTRLIYGLG